MGTRLLDNLYFTRGDLKAGVLVSLLSVWVLVGLFYYLNRYTKRRYFTIWTVAWLFYALWITLSFGVEGSREHVVSLILMQWCVGVSAVFLLWGSLTFLGQATRAMLFGLLILFLLVWSSIATFRLSRPLQLEVPIFSLIAVSSWVTAASFFKYRRDHPYVGATMLTVGFLLWGLYMAVYPFLENSEDLISVALFISACLQLIMAVSMIILVLEEVRQTHKVVLEEVKTGRAQRDELEFQVLSTEERYRKLFDQASESIIITSTEDFRILELNQAAQRLLGLERSEADRHSFTSLCQVPGNTGAPPRTHADWFQFLLRQRPVNLVRKDGSLVPVEINGSQVDFAGQPTYQFFILEVTERTRLEQQLRQAEKLSALGQMISGVAHELNNPLAVVKGYLELILAHHQLAPQTRVDLEKVAHESNRAAKLVMNFLSFAREQPAHRELINLNQMIERLMEVRKFDLLVAKTELILELEPQLPPVHADPDQVQQLIVNLVNNSLQAMVDSVKPNRLKVTTRHREGRVLLLVEDNGPGVPPQLVSKIFEPFFTTKEVGTGTGLGLSIAHSIMADHHGRIQYQTSSLGGAGFVLDFPAAKSAPVAAAGDPEAAKVKAATLPPAHGEKILVLDDEKAIAEMLGEMLGILGYAPTICHAAAHALELISQHDFDLIISDFRMPGINGEQFYGLAVKQKPELARRIIFLTGDTVNEDTLEFLESIGNPHLTKPFNLASVKSIVAEVIQAHPAAGVRGGSEAVRTAEG